MEEFGQEFGECALARSDYFRKNAETCMANAQQASAEETRTAWLKMAARWHELAQEAEADEPILPPPPSVAADAPVVQQQQQIQPKPVSEE